MAYVRKTRDEFQLWINYGYGHGWEHEISEDSYREFKARRKEYRENCPQYPTRLVKKRVPIEGAA